MPDLFSAFVRGGFEQKIMGCGNILLTAITQYINDFVKKLIIDSGVFAPVSGGDTGGRIGI